MLINTHTHTHTHEVPCSAVYHTFMTSARPILRADRAVLMLFQKIVSRNSFVFNRQNSVYYRETWKLGTWRDQHLWYLVPNETVSHVTLKHPFYKLQYQEISGSEISYSQKLFDLFWWSNNAQYTQEHGRNRRSILRLLSEKVGLFYHLTKLLACGKDTISAISGISAIPEQIGIQALVA